MNSSWFKSTFLKVFEFLQIKKWEPNFRGEPILQNVSIIWSLLLCFNFKRYMDTISASFIRFQFILHDMGLFFAEFWNLYNLKRVNVISGRNQFCRKPALFGPALCISILKVLWTQIFRHSLDFNALCMIQKYFSQSFEISSN